MRPGSRMHGDKEIPANAYIFKTKTGRECYYAGRSVSEEDGSQKALIRFLDTMELREVDWLLIKPYVKI